MRYVAISSLITAATSGNCEEFMSSFLEDLQMRIQILFSILWTLKDSYFLIYCISHIDMESCFREEFLKRAKVLFSVKKIGQKIWNMCPGFFQPLALVWFLHTNGFLSSVWYVSRNPYSTYKSSLGMTAFWKKVSQKTSF